MHHITPIRLALQKGDLFELGQTGKHGVTSSSNCRSWAWAPVELEAMLEMLRMEALKEGFGFITGCLVVLNATSRFLCRQAQGLRHRGNQKNQFSDWRSTTLRDATAKALEGAKRKTENGLIH